MRQLALLVVILTVGTPLTASSFAPPGIVAAGKHALLAVSPFTGDMALIDPAEGRVVRIDAPFVSTGTAMFDPVSGLFRGTGRDAKGSDLLWSLDEANGDLRIIAAGTVTLERLALDGRGHVLVSAAEDGRRSVLRVRRRLESIGTELRFQSGTSLFGDDVLCAPCAAVASPSGILTLALPETSPGQRQWYEARLGAGWLLVNPTNGCAFRSTDGENWQKSDAPRSPQGEEITPISLHATADHKEAFLFGCISSCDAMRRGVWRINDRGEWSLVGEVSSEQFDDIVAGPGGVWVVGHAWTGQGPLRFAAVGNNGVGPRQQAFWP